MPTNGFSVKPLKVQLLAGEQKASEDRVLSMDRGTAEGRSNPGAGTDAKSDQEDACFRGPSFFLLLFGCFKHQPVGLFQGESRLGGVMFLCWTLDILERGPPPKLAGYFCLHCFSATAESFGVSAQIGSGVVRGGPERGRE